jgi:hypothetical protein
VPLLVDGIETVASVLNIPDMVFNYLVDNARIEQSFARTNNLVGRSFFSHRDGRARCPFVNHQKNACGDKWIVKGGSMAVISKPEYANTIGADGRAICRGQTRSCAVSTQSSGDATIEAKLESHQVPTPVGINAMQQNDAYIWSSFPRLLVSWRWSQRPHHY